MNERIPKLKEKALKLPTLPGVYIMRDKSEKIIYIGKAKSLKNRVNQYFTSIDKHDEKVYKMVQNVFDFDYIITDSEFEALVLECSLIKQHAPKYNILLKDDKGYHYIKITKEQWPRISESKQMINDGARYIGPYTSGYTVNQSIDEANKVFRLPVCTRKFPQDIGKYRPCLNYFIKQCIAPCQGKVKLSEYKELVNEAVDFLQGGSAQSIKRLTGLMEQAAESFDFEKAAKLRDRIKAIQKIKERQKVVASKIPEQDVIALACVGTKACVEIFRFRSGRLCDRETFLLGEVGSAENTRAEIITQFYTMREYIPPVISLDGMAEDMDLLAEWLTEKAGRKVKITVPQKGNQYQLVLMCRNNASEHLAQQMGRTGKETAALDELGRLLGLESAPRYIESYDISNTAGSENVAGMVVFEDGRPLKAAYRKFAIKGFEGQDDYASMNEVLTRRFARYFESPPQNEGFSRLPDLILLDGGKGQVSAVLPVLAQFGLSIPVFGMVKDDKHRTRAIACDGGEIAINSNRSAFTLIANIQEEVHRFAISFHRQKRSSTMISSSLLSIKGIGEARAKALLKHFKTMTKIKQATKEELCAVKGMNEVSAQAMIDYFKSEE